MSDFEELEDFEEQLPAAELSPLIQPGWAKALAWATIVLGGIYLINPTAGVFELIPDVIPVVGNLDEAAAMFLVFAALRYLGVRLPDFIERWVQPAPQLPASTDPEQ